MEQLTHDGPRDTWPTDRAGLMALSDAAAEVDLWTTAARLGGRAISPDPRDVGPRIEVVWRMWRAGRPSEALGLLAALPDEVHPALPLLRAAAVATRDRTAAAVRAMLVTAGRLAPRAQNLMIVALAAEEVGDHATARDAAQRYLAAVRPDEPALRGIVAPAQAAHGDTVAAVTSTEQACAGRVTGREAPIDAVVDQLREDGRDDLAVRYLAEGVLRTGRPRYGELLEQLLPARVRQRRTRIAAPLLLILLLVLGGVALRPHGDVPVVGLLVPTVVGLGVSVRSVLTRVPGTTLRQTHRITAAVNRHRRRDGRDDLVLPALGAAATGFAYGAVTGATRTTEPLTRIALPPLVVGGLFAAGAAALVLVVGGRRRTRVRAALRERVPVDRCRCWERDWFAGPTWHDYLRQHLEAGGSDRALGATLLRCPATAKTWMHVDDADLTVRVVLPEPADPAAHL
jgi:hypothetical protein